MNIGHILALVVKEFLTLLRDKRSRLVIVAPPIMQLIIFGFAATFDLNHVPIAVYNQDQGAESRELISHFEGSPHFDVLHRISHEQAIAPLIDNRDVLLVLVIDSQFSSQLAQGKPASLQVLIDGRNSNTALIASNYVQNILQEFNRHLARPNLERPRSIELNIRSWYNENLQSQWFIIPGIVGLLTLVVTLLVTALSVAREREAGTFDQLLVTPLRPVEILIGKAVPGMVIGLFEGSLIILLAVVCFGVPLRGDIGALYLGLVLFILSATGVGLMISSFAVTQQQAILGTFMFLVPAVILSGFSTPIANMPEALQWLTHLDPLRYFLIIVRSVFLEGSSYANLTHQYWPMAVIGVLALSLAGWLFRRRLY